MVGDGGEGLIRRIAENFKYFQNLHCSLDSRIIKILLGFRVFFFISLKIWFYLLTDVCVYLKLRGETMGGDLIKIIENFPNPGGGN